MYGTLGSYYEYDIHSKGGDLSIFITKSLEERHRLITATAMDLGYFTVEPADQHFTSQDKVFMPKVVGSDFVLLELFCEQLTKSDAVAFDIRRLPTSISLKRVSALGRQFYEVMPWRKREVPRHHEPAPLAGELVEYVAKKLCNACFSGNPLALYNQAGTLEGEAINSILADVLSNFRKAGCRNKREQRKREYISRRGKVSRYLRALCKLHPQLYVLRLEFGHTPDSSLVFDDPRSADFIHQLIAEVMTDDNVVGHVARRYFFEHTGYQLHLTLFIDSANSNPNQVAQRIASSICKHDSNITFFNHITHIPQLHRSWGCGLVAENNYSTLHALASSFTIMLVRDRFLRLDQTHAENFILGTCPKIDDRKSNCVPDVIPPYFDLSTAMLSPTYST